MAVTHLRPDYQAHPRGDVTTSQTVAVGATVAVPKGYDTVVLEVGTLSATSPIVPLVKTPSSTKRRAWPEDVYGTTFPANVSASGDFYILVGMPMTGFEINASHAGTGNVTITAQR